MSTVTINPDSTSANTGALTGGATAHAVLSDASDASYITYDPSEASTVGLGNTSISADSIITGITLYAKAGTVTGTTVMTVGLATGGSSKVGYQQIITSAPTDYAVLHWNVAGAGFVDANIDALTASIGCIHDTNDLRVYEARVVVTYYDPATVTVDAPTGTVTDTNQVTVEWSTDTTPPVSQAQIKIFTDAVFSGGGFDPDTSALVLSSTAPENATSLYFSDALADGTYHAAVQVTDNYNEGGETTSDWAYSEFEVDVAKPAEPDLTLIPSDEDAYIAIILEDNVGDATTDWFEAERWDGEDWVFVRTVNEDGTIDIEDGVGGAVDYEAPNGVEQTYRVRAVHDYGDGNTAASDWVTDTATWESDQWWIKHPTLPSMNVAITLRSNPGYSRESRAGVFQPLQGEYPIHVSDTPTSKRGEMVVLGSLADGTHDALEALIEAHVPLLWQGPPAHYQEDRWIVLSGFTSQRLVDKAWFHDVDDSLPWTQVRRPSNAQLVIYGLYPADELYPSEDLFPGP